MNVAEWIIVAILSLALFVFLIVGIIFLLKMLDLVKETKIVVKTSQDVAEKTSDVVDNVKDMTSVSGIVKAVARRIENSTDASIEVVDETSKTKTKAKTVKEAETVKTTKKS